MAAQENDAMSGSGMFLLGAGAGLSVGLLIGYFTSPYRGSTMRNMLRDQISHYMAESRKAAQQLGAKTRHVRNMARGAVMEAKSSLIGSAREGAQPE